MSLSTGNNQNLATFIIERESATISYVRYHFIMSSYVDDILLDQHKNQSFIGVSLVFSWSNAHARQNGDQVYGGYGMKMQW